MLAAPILPDEELRLRSLESLELTGSAPEERFDSLTRLAAQIFGVPIAFLALLDANQQWFKSSCGLQVSRTDRSVSFCGHTIAQGEMLVIPDTLQDERFADNPLVQGDPWLRFYAGYPLQGPNGHNIGTFCIADQKPRKFSSEQLDILANLALMAERELNNIKLISLHKQLAVTAEELHQSNEENKRLLLNILPPSIAERLLKGEQVIADRFPEATILFADLVGFSGLTHRMDSDALVEMLNAIFSAFDQLCHRLGMEKIKTIGDAYMAACGLPQPRPDHAVVAAQAALAMRQALEDLNRRHKMTLQLRIGINTGPVIAGVIGTHKFIYDLWGEAVNLASRMESHGVPGEIQIAPATYAKIQEHFVCESRGPVEVKGVGTLSTYFLKGPKAVSPKSV